MLDHNVFPVFTPDGWFMNWLPLMDSGHLRMLLISSLVTAQRTINILNIVWKLTPKLARGIMTLPGIISCHLLHQKLQ